MSRQWKRQAIAAVAVMAILFGAAAAHGAAMIARCMPAAVAEETKAAPTVRWATIIQSAATHAGPGLRYAMNGRITAGHAVEVLCERDGWYKCWLVPASEPVWIFGEYMIFH